MDRKTRNSKHTGEQNIREVRRITWIGLIANIILAALKMIVGVLGSSQAIVADAVHSISDMTTDIAVLIGVRLWSHPADECHPYGHRRIESIVTVGIGVTLVAVALAIGYRGIASVRDVHIVQPRWIAFIGAAISIVAKEALYRWTLHVGKRTRSAAVRANAWHHRSDALSSIPAALAVAIAAFDPHWSFVDHIGAVIVALFILHASWRIIGPALAELSDMGAPVDITTRICEAASATEDVHDVHAVRTRRMGPSVFVDLHITVDGAMTVHWGHLVSEAVKRNIQNQVPDVVDVVVHLEPSGPDAGERRLDDKGPAGLDP
jgi:cation diffusion facilitator family transporter